MLRALSLLLTRLGLTGKVAVVTDGHLSGLVDMTLQVCEVSFEAAAGGPLALVEDGDISSIDVAGKSVNLEVKEDLVVKWPANWATHHSQRGCTRLAASL